MNHVRHMNYFNATI